MACVCTEQRRRQQQQQTDTTKRWLRATLSKGPWVQSSCNVYIPLSTEHNHLVGSLVCALQEVVGSAFALCAQIYCCCVVEVLNGCAVLSCGLLGCCLAITFCLDQHEFNAELRRNLHRNLNF